MEKYLKYFVSKSHFSPLSHTLKFSNTLVSTLEHGLMAGIVSRALWKYSLADNIRNVEVFLKKKTSAVDIMTHFTNKSYDKIPNYSVYKFMTQNKHPDGQAHGDSIQPMPNYSQM